jgi:hypothetical protein
MKKLALLLTLLLSVSAFAQTTLPNPATIVAGQPFSVVASADGTTPFTFEWSKGSTVIAGATTEKYSVKSAVAPDAGVYTAKITNGKGSVVTPPATIIVTPVVTVTPPVITVQPVATQTQPLKGSAVFTVVATGTGPFTYQWNKDGKPWPYGQASAKTATFTNPNLDPSDAGSYTVTITGPGGTVTSAPSILTIGIASTSPTSPAIKVTQP